MNTQLDAVLDINLDDQIFRDLLDVEIMLVGGGEASQTTY